MRYLDHLVTHETCHQWFWNVVGTDGYAETFMDEGLVNGFTALRLDAKYGRNAPLIVWPQGLTWLPTIGREDLRLSGYYGWRARGNGGPVIRDLKTMGNLGALFSLAYDRGGKVIEMIHNRLGDDRFFAFFRKVYHDYAFETFHYADLKRELAAFDPSGDWADVPRRLADRARRDRLGGRAGPGRRRPTADRATAAGDGRAQAERGDGRADGRPLPLRRRATSGCRSGPTGAATTSPAPSVERDGDDRWVVTVQAPGAPTQVMVDPDHALLDAVPDNNRWKPEVAWRFTPLMTPLDESSQFQAYDRASVVAGPFIDQYARGGFKVGVQRLDRWQVDRLGRAPSRRSARRSSAASPRSSTSPGRSGRRASSTRKGLYNFYNDKRHSGGRAFLRYRFLETSSFLSTTRGSPSSTSAPATSSGPGDDGRPVEQVARRHRRPVPAEHALPLLGPGPGRADRGDRRVRQHGARARASTTSAIDGRVRIVRPLPDVVGHASRKSRLAFRVYGGFGFPDTAPLFRLGGGRRLRALDLTPEHRQLGLAGDPRVAVPALARDRPGRARPRRRRPQPLRRGLLRRRPVVPPRPTGARSSTASASACGSTSPCSPSSNAPPSGSTSPSPSASAPAAR